MPFMQLLVRNLRLRSDLRSVHGQVSSFELGQLAWRVSKCLCVCPFEVGWELGQLLNHGGSENSSPIFPF